MNPVTNHYIMSSPAERARLRVVYALLGTAFFMPLQLIAMECCLVFAAAAAVQCAKKYGMPPMPSPPAGVPAAGFFIAAFLSLAGSPETLLGLAFYAFTIVQYAVLYVLAAYFLRGEEERRLVLMGLLFGAACTAAYGLYQYAHMLTLGEAEWVDNSAFPMLRRRMYSTLYNPNLLSAFLLMVMGAAASLTICRPGRRSKALWASLFCVLSLCLILTYSRGAWLSAAALVLYFGAVWDKRLWLLFLAVPAVLFFYHGGVADRLMSIFTYSEADTSVSMRMAMWTAAWDMAADHPVLGVGWGAFKYIYPVYNEFIQEAGITIYHAHNMFFNILAETGWIGLMFYLWFFFGTGLRALQHLRRGAAGSDRAVAMTAGAAVVSQAVCGIGDYDLFSTQIALVFWMLCGLFANMDIEGRQGKKPPAEP